MALNKIISGGQTGVDRGALDAALVDSRLKASREDLAVALIASSIPTFGRILGEIGFYLLDPEKFDA